MISQARQLLDTLKPDEVRLQSWLVFLPQVFEMERELLTRLVQDEGLMSDLETDTEKADVIDHYLANMELSKEKTAKAISNLQVLIDRLKQTPDLYLRNVNSIKSTMEDNMYYGKSKDGTRIFSMGKPRD